MSFKSDILSWSQTLRGWVRFFTQMPKRASERRDWLTAVRWWQFVFGLWGLAFLLRALGPVLRGW